MTPNPTKATGNLRAIADALNLSTGTISRALSGRGDVAQETRDKVAEVAATLNYLPRRRRAAQREGPSRIGLCIGNPCVSPSGIRDQSYVGLHYLVAIERAASNAQSAVMVAFTDAMAPEQPLADLPIMRPDQTDAMILVYPFPEPFVRQLATRTTVVSIEHVYPGASLDTIGPAHSLDAMSAVEYLHGLGHRRIAYVCDEEARGHKLTMGLRHAGYVSGLQRCDLPYRPEDVANVFGPRITKADLTQWAVDRVKSGVTAVITSIDRHGYLLWDRLPDSGVRVPQDVSLVGIGGIHRPAGLGQLTTWRCNFDAIATAAFDAIRTRFTGARSNDSYMEIPSTFVAGESAGAPNV